MRTTRSGARLFSALLDILFPPRCHVCREFIPDAGRIHLCVACRAQLTPIGSPLCPCCGIPFTTVDGIDHPCGTCLATPPPFRASRSALLFAGPARELIHRLKYGGTVHHRRPLGLLTAELLAPFAADRAPDLLVPVPLHVRRLRQRGFNQAVLLGEVLGREWGVPLAREVLRRIRWTEPQVGLPAAERADNVRGAFAVADPIRVAGRRVMLVDDVCTTGSTLYECGRTLRKAGAAEVLAVTVARALDH